MYDISWEKLFGLQWQQKLCGHLVTHNDMFMILLVDAS